MFGVSKSWWRKKVEGIIPFSEHLEGATALMETSGSNDMASLAKTLTDLSNTIKTFLFSFFDATGVDAETKIDASIKAANYDALSKSIKDRKVGDLLPTIQSTLQSQISEWKKNGIPEGSDIKETLSKLKAFQNTLAEALAEKIGTNRPDITDEKYINFMAEHLAQTIIGLPPEAIGELSRIQAARITSDIADNKLPLGGIAQTLVSAQLSVANAEKINADKIPDLPPLAFNTQAFDAAMAEADQARIAEAARAAAAAAAQGGAQVAAARGNSSPLAPRVLRTQAPGSPG